LALAALALVVFGAYDSYPTLLAMGKKETPYVLYKLATLFLPKNWPDVCLQRHATSGEGMGGEWAASKKKMELTAVFAEEVGAAESDPYRLVRGEGSEGCRLGLKRFRCSPTLE